MRKCSKCKILKDESEFYNVKSKIYYYCIECSKSDTLKRQKRNKQQALDYKGGKCAICDYNKCMNALEFHHLDPKEKDFTIGKYHGRVFETIKGELDKCILLCRNCHTEVHAGFHQEIINRARVSELPSKQ